MNEIDLKLKFPDLEPIDSVPSLSTWNGCGFTLFGSRGYDEETRSSVQTYCLSLLFIPIVALRAYRVAQLGYNRLAILGRVPLSGVAKIWNLFLVVGVVVGLGGWGWTTYRNSPDQVAYRQLVKAKQQFAAGKFADGAALYQQVAFGSTKRSAQAQAELQQLLDAPTTPEEGRLAVARVAVALARQNRWPSDGATLAKSIREHAARLGDKNPSQGLALCELIDPLDTDRPAWKALHLDLLTRAVAKDPRNAELVSKLALIYEADDKLDECEKLLTPLAAQLGTHEGARILGQILVRQEKHDEAYALLLPYTEQKLQGLHAAEQGFNNAVTSAQQRLMDQLRTGKASDFNYRRYEGEGAAQQEAMVVDYVSARIKDDASIKAAQDALQEAATVVPAALDLGMVLLRRGQELMDPEARKSELERAEKVFLAVNGVASDNDQYRLYLGQVYYWLGKHEEGHKLFEELLASQGRSHRILMGVSQLLYQVGEMTEARRRCEEAYDKAQNDNERYDAAGLRVTLPIDLEDRVTWLAKCNPASTATKSLLASSRGELAIRQGDVAGAERLLREAIDHYSKDVETDASLNNAALVCFTLFQVTGDTAVLEKGVAMMDKAVALSPSDSRVLGNAAGALLRSSLGQIVGKHLDLVTLKREGSWELCSFLYDDEAGRQKLLAEIRKHPGVIRAASYYDKARLLSPKRPDLWMHVAGIHTATDNLEGLRTLADQAARVEFDTAEMLEEYQDLLAGKHDERNKTQVTAAIARLKPALEAARAKNAVTFAAAVQEYVEAARSGEYLNEEVDYDPLVQLADEAYRAAPSSAARWTLKNALLGRACRMLASQNPEFASLVTHTRRTLSPEYQVAWALSRGDQFSQTALDNADVKRAVELQRESQIKFAASPSEWDWALLRNDADLAGKIAAKVKQEDLQQLGMQLAQQLSPYSAIGAVRSVWRAEITGAPDEGVQILRKLADQGVAVPTLAP